MAYFPRYCYVRLSWARFGLVRDSHCTSPSDDMPAPGTVVDFTIFMMVFSIGFRIDSIHASDSLVSMLYVILYIAYLCQRDVTVVDATMSVIVFRIGVGIHSIHASYSLVSILCVILQGRPKAAQDGPRHLERYT